MMSGQSVLLSTMTRNCLPPYAAKSTAICWKGLSGSGFVTRGSRGVGWQVVMAVAASIHEVLNVPINVGPLNG